MIRVYKLDANGEEVLHYDGEVIERGPTWIHVKAIFQIEEADIGFVVFRRGDVFHEWFYTDRWYNVFRIEDGNDGSLKGWYCNISRPATITSDSIRADDLALDVFVMPDGTVHVLDKDEFALLNLQPEEREAAQYAVEDIRQRVAQKAAPFYDRRER